MLILVFHVSELSDEALKVESKVEEARRKVSEQSTERYNSVLDAHEKSKELDKTFKDLTKEVQILGKEKEAIDKQREEAIKKYTKLELDYEDLKESISGDKRAKDDAVKQLEILQKEIQDSQEELNKIRPLYNNQVREEEDITRGYVYCDCYVVKFFACSLWSVDTMSSSFYISFKSILLILLSGMHAKMTFSDDCAVLYSIMECEKKLSILYQKRGRATQFANKADRDKWLQREIDEYERVLSSNLTQEEKIEDEIQQLNADIQVQDDYIVHRQTEIADLESVISHYCETFNQLKSQRDKLQDERKSLWGKESELSGEIDRLKTEVVKAEKNLDHATPGDIRRGLNSVRRICRESGILGVFGPIIELVDCDEKFFTAVEVTAGNSLFHVVVETDEISTQIIRHLNALKGGRVTFIPLNRVKAPQITYPQSSDVIPLLKKLKFKRDFTPAFAQVFGRTVICRDLDVATRVARTDGLDCITLEGDQVSKKGGMTGGFYDYRRSKLKLMNVIKENTNSVNKKEAELEEVRFKLQDILEIIDQKITELVAEQQKNDAKHAHDRSEREQLKEDIANARKQKESISKALEKKEKLLANVRTQIGQLKANISMKQDEMGTELVDHLTPEEKDLLQRLNPEITELKETLIACRANRIETETRKAELETNLSTNLVRRRQELEAVKVSGETDKLDAEAEAKKQELADATLLVEDVTQQLKRVSGSIDERTRQLGKIKDEKNKLKSLEESYQNTLQDEAKELEQLLSNRNILVAKKEEYLKKSRELGPLSSDAFDVYYSSLNYVSLLYSKVDFVWFSTILLGDMQTKHRRRSIKELHKMLHRCNEQLQQFSHVNKKALDQYVNFTEQREELQKRQAELDAGDEKIRELISVLDQRKDESIERTFKGVAKHFREVFSELVQGGHGFLVMMKKKDGDQGDDDQDEDAPRVADMEGRVEKYIGVKVSFTGQGETQSMKQLSGGQKTVVALTLIFAIQRCDPAPFYLFDEIDAALDPQYRTAVGNMIRRLADMANTQFITTTFRPELVKVADKIYGVKHKHRVSNVEVISKEEALIFIEQDQSHNV
ncbi:hypothetical protein RHGRI_002113 [Rhododendron griersonianum]|uniref:SMC hinge domain-containing protein n=1 Tax=Rhododendron griersonianum TaxID=479676 RepID=A0AAV6LQS3_9ERIC|nr:hypothetical protein RHGRI_002113 [Rhododendron griersonianum]